MSFVTRQVASAPAPLEGYRRISHRPYSAALISALSGHPHSRQTLLAADPFLVFESVGRSCRWMHPESGLMEKAEGNPFDIFFQRWCTEKNVFAIGYWGYDLKDHLEPLDDRSRRAYDLPDAQWMLFEAVVRTDHAENRTSIEGRPDAVERLARMMSQSPGPVVPTRRHYSVRPEWSKSDYVEAVSAIRNRIRAGDVYEVNLTQRFHVDLSSSGSRDFELLSAMIATTPSPFTAILRSPQSTVISSSPERFMRLQDGVMECEPIKGTRPRGTSFDEDESAFLSLIHSEKDRAENLMIVDLMRNDLGRVATIGTVEVPRLFHIDAYRTVFQMSSTIVARLAENYTWMDAVKAAFPPGSMTGAPKIAAMNIIEELEPVKRQVYSGVLGYVDWKGHLDLSVIIRTLVLQDESGYFQTGGAIVWDSDADAEYQECLDKARGILHALEAWSEASGGNRSSV